MAILATTWGHHAQQVVQGGTAVEAAPAADIQKRMNASISQTATSVQGADLKAEVRHALLETAEFKGLIRKVDSLEEDVKEHKGILKTVVEKQDATMSVLEKLNSNIVSLSSGSSGNVLRNACKEADRAASNLSSQTPKHIPETWCNFFVLAGRVQVNKEVHEAFCTYTGTGSGRITIEALTDPGYIEIDAYYAKTKMLKSSTQ